MSFRTPGVWLAACWRRRWLRRTVLLAALLAAMYGSSGWWLPAAGHWLNVGEMPRRCDYCLVLSGDVESRPFAAAALYRREFVRDQIWLTHAVMADTPPADSGAPNSVAKRILTVLGVPADRIVELPGDCSTTYDEALVLARAMAKHPTATVNVVTSDFHTRRSRWIIRRVLGSDAERVRYVSVPTDYFDADCWWKVESGFTTYTKEFLKNIFYRLRYGWGGVWIAVILIAVGAAWALRRLRKRGAPSPQR